MDRVRSFTASLRIQRILMKDAKRWYRLCSSMDTIEDSQLAIDAYRKIAWGKGEGRHYLFVYGLLQALYVQQDALSDLCSCFGYQVKVKSDKTLSSIRYIRNDVVGHPTNSTYKDHRILGWHFINRSELQKNRILVQSDYVHGSQSRWIDLKKIMADQHASMETTLLGLIVFIEHRFQNYLLDGEPV